MSKQSEFNKLPKFNTGCTLIGASGDYTDTGNVLIASTSDNEYIRGPRKPVVVNSSIGKYRVIHTPCLLKCDDGTFVNEGSDRGLNSAGFCWTRSWAITNERPPDRLELKAKEWFLALGSSVSCVKEAIDYMTRSPRPFGVNGNYILGDTRGYLAAVELGFHQYEIAHYFNPDESGIITRVNEYETPKMRKIDHTSYNASMYHETSHLRKSRLRELILKYKILSSQTMKEILSDQLGNKQISNSSHGAGICSIGITHGTVSSEIILPKEMTFYYRYGFPSLVNINLNQEIFGANINSWDDWLPFQIDELHFDCNLSTWDGVLTPEAIDYFSF